MTPGLAQIPNGVQIPDPEPQVTPIYTFDYKFTSKEKWVGPTPHISVRIIKIHRPFDNCGFLNL